MMTEIDDRDGGKPVESGFHIDHAPRQFNVLELRARRGECRLYTLVPFGQTTASLRMRNLRVRNF
jgi:hypothetical protein